MIAVFKTGGKQYSVQVGQILKIEKIEGKKGDDCVFKEILAINDKTSSDIGKPIIKGASIKAKILDQIRDKKILVFKKRRRKNYRSTQGHRQYLTVLRIESITSGNGKISNTEQKTEKKVIKKVTKKTIAKNDSADTTKKRKIAKKIVVKKSTKGKK